MTTATVYTTTTCPYCTMMIDYLDEQKVAYRVVNVQEDRQVAKELVEKTGQMGVPQTELNGKWILGFDPAAVQAALSEDE